MDNGTRIRAFLALTFSVAVTRKIAEEIERRRNSVPAKVAWVPPANLHLTLQFLGSIDENLIEGIVVGLKKIAARHAPFEARARGLGAFPDLQHPKVLWVGVEGDGLARLQKDVEGAMLELGFPKEERAFHPHVTVGRVKETAALPDWNAAVECGASTIGEIVVYESRSIKTGVEYVARARVALGKGD
jgi:RNA 2',3'-cyclic 3'-phosphodiesterase